MPDRRHHRGPHPEDLKLFSRDKWDVLTQAIVHLSWLLSHGYALTSSLKLVGDRFGLARRQRVAVQRSACSDQARKRRLRHQVSRNHLRGQVLDVDGFNLITTIESAWAGGVLLYGRDGCLRDMASMHGSYRKVAETELALGLIGGTLAPLKLQQCCWWLDQPVSNSGRLSQFILSVAEKNGWPWTTQLVPDPDPILRESPHVVVTADSGILDVALRWYNLAPSVVRWHFWRPWIVPDEMLP